MNTKPSLHFSTSSRRRLAAASLFASALFMVGWALLAPISTANAGEWVQRSCSFGGTEYIAPEDWEGEENYSYDRMPYDNCERYYNGGALEALASGWDGTKPGSGQTWRYKAPRYATIAGDDLAVTMTVRDGGALVGAKVKEQPVTLAICENPGCHGYEHILPITASGASELYETAYCFGNSEGISPAENFNTDEGEGHEAAEVNISSAEIVLSTNVAPAASAFSGTLLDGTVTGTGTLDFKATDAGPGIYQARAKVDSQQVWAATPNLNEGKCVSTGTTEGVRAFNYAQPCPTETAVHAEINTAGLPDDTHALTVELEDAAGDVTTVYTGTLTTVNHATVFTPTPAPVERGPCTGTPCVEAAKLTATPGAAHSFNKALKHSTCTITGQLTTTAGLPIKDAQVKLLQQIVGSAATTHLATATTTADGSWSMKAPAGPSRLLRVAFYSHTLDSVPAATLDFHENVPATISIHAPPARQAQAVLHLLRAAHRRLHPRRWRGSPGADQLRRRVARASARGRQQAAESENTATPSPSNRAPDGRSAQSPCATAATPSQATKAPLFTSPFGAE